MAGKAKKIIKTDRTNYVSKKKNTDNPDGADKNIICDYVVSQDSHMLFDLACDKVIHNAHMENGIGTLSEKTVHAVLKNYLEPDTSYHEIKTGRYYADIRTPDGIIEIQTRQFNKLRNKLDVFLPEYSVTLVYPIPHIKYLRWIDKLTGEISPARKSPKKGVFQEVFYELYKIKPYLTNSNLHLLLLLIDLEEYRFLDGYSADHKKGSSRSDRIPVSLYAQEAIYSVSDYKKLIPEDMPEQFTVKDFARFSHVTPAVAQPAVNVLCHVGAIEHIGKRGLAYLYRRVS